MTTHFTACALAVLVLVSAASSAASSAAAQPIDPDDRRVANLTALARLYGAVRFFHPSDEAAATEWGGFMMYAATRVTHARDADDLCTTLRTLFEPIAPTISITVGPPADDAPAAAPPGTHVHWRHRGIQYGERSNVYRSLRLPTDEPSTPEDVRIDPGAHAIIDLGRDVVARVPLTLPINADGATRPAADPALLAELRADVAGVRVAMATGNDVYARAATIGMIWAAMEHFFPYFDEIEADWDAALPAFLGRALLPQDRDTFALVVSSLVEQLEDGHGIIGYRSTRWSHVPSARFERLRGGEIAVTAAWDDCPLERGDVVVSIDGRPAEDELAMWRSVTPGSAHLQEHRAFNRFGSGQADTIASLVVERGGAEQTIGVPRSERSNLFFRNPAFDHPMFEEVAEGIWYVNLQKIDGAGFAAHADRLIEADGIILDYRWGRSPADDFDSRDIVRMTTDQPLESPAWQYPLATRPGHEHRGWFESSWSYFPVEPRLEAKVAVLVGPPVVSFGETLMSFYRHYDLGILVGSPTAGCNGNANTLTDLPAKINVTFTGMKVEQHDGSTLYGVGYEPDVPVVPSLEGIRAGRDEVRGAAIEALQR